MLLCYKSIGKKEFTVNSIDPIIKDGKRFSSNDSDDVIKDFINDN